MERLKGLKQAIRWRVLLKGISNILMPKGITHALQGRGPSNRIEDPLPDIYLDLFDCCRI
jgi:hypothetical protein